MKKNKLPGIVTILILTLITAFMWISFNVYRAFTIQPETKVPEEILKPLSPTLDTDTLGKIGNRPLLDDSQIPEVGSGSTGVGGISGQ